MRRPSDFKKNVIMLMYTNTKILSAYIMYRLYFVKLDDRKKSDDSSSDIYLGIKSEVESSEGI